MLPTPKELLKKLTDNSFSHVDRAVAVLWLLHTAGATDPRSAKDLASELEAAGYGTQNAHRLGKQLDKDNRAVKQNGGYRLNIKSLVDLDAKFGGFTGPQLPPPTDSVLPLELFFDTRQYLERVVHQANAAFDNALYDCCSVMLRRVAETLIIEVYENDGREAEIQDGAGNYEFLSALVNHIKADKQISLSRNTRTALDDMKRLGDLSAHNRRYNAVQNDIERVRDGMRTASQELLVLSGLR